MVKEAFDIIRKEGMKKEYKSEDETPIEAIQKCLPKIVFDENDVVIDAGSGTNKIWFNKINVKNKMEFEIREGKDFLKFDGSADWVVGNPPYHEWLLFLLKSTEISRKGFAFLINHTRLNQLTPHRLNVIASKGFYLSRIHILEIKKWFGRYYFLIFTKEKNENITW